eukprot:4804523-Prymnesium_polylepis.1
MAGLLASLSSVLAFAGRHLFRWSIMRGDNRRASAYRSHKNLRLTVLRAKIRDARSSAGFGLSLRTDLVKSAR